jgi:putative flavoprotein involved in K+ transport
MPQDVDVVIVGAGQAGLATSHELTEAGVEHVLLEQDTVASAWRRRWDSFCLVTPNATIRLPGGEYAGDDPDGFLPRDGVVDHLEVYARSFGAPVRSGVRVESLEQRDGTLRLGTTAGPIRARAVVAATGAYQRALRPAWVGSLPGRLTVLEASGYRNPESLAPGGVLVVGSGQTGCQLAEELFRAGRRVVLACGRAPWITRRIGGRDTVRWMLDIGLMDMSVTALPSPAARLAANPQATGGGGGHDLHFRTLAALGVELVGHVVDVDGDTLLTAPDLAESVAFGDARYADLCAAISAHCVAHGLPVPDMPAPTPFDASGPDQVDLSGITTVILTMGYRPAYRDWIHAADVVDDLGFPRHADGASTAVRGLYFVGVHYLRTRKSSLLMGVGEDAALVAAQIREQVRAGSSVL